MCSNSLHATDRLSGNLVICTTFSVDCVRVRLWLFVLGYTRPYPLIVFLCAGRSLRVVLTLTIGQGGCFARRFIILDLIRSRTSPHSSSLGSERPHVHRLPLCAALPLPLVWLSLPILLSSPGFCLFPFVHATNNAYLVWALGPPCSCTFFPPFLLAPPG